MEQEEVEAVGTAKDGESMTRCVIYARVSTSMQAEEEVPIAGQIAECEKHAKMKGYEVVGVFQDAGVSGGTDERPEFQKMYTAAKEKPRPFDVVLTWRANRLFRSVELRLAYSKAFNRAGVKLESLHEPDLEGAAGKVIETVIATFDEYTRAVTSEDTLRGLKQIAAQGYSTGGRPPTGYRNVRKATGLKRNGEPVMRTIWEVDSEVAPRVLKAFEMCAEGKSSVEIVEATHIVAAKNGLSTLFRNRAYLGERIYNATRRASLSDKKHIRLKNKTESLVTVKASHPAIVPQELFDRVQAIQDRKRPKTTQYKVSPRQYLLSGLLWCKTHNAPYTGHTTAKNCYYACGMRQKLGKRRVDCAWLKKEPLEQFVVESLKTAIFTPTLIRQGLEYLKREQIRNRQEDDSQGKEIARQLKQADVELANFKNAIKQGVNPEILAEDINELAQRKAKLELRLEQIKQERDRAVQIDVDEATVNDLLEMVREMFSVADPKELKAALARFVEKIEVVGNEVVIYSLLPTPTEFVFSNGDPGGLSVVNTIRNVLKIPDRVWVRTSTK